MIQQNLVVNDPELKDLFDLFRRDIFSSLNCHAIAKIQVFNSANQTATATVNYKKTYFVSDPTDPIGNNYIPNVVDYPFLVDCPVICLGGGNGVLTFPVQTGDDCLVLFNDRDIDNWFQGSSSSPVNTSRMHSFSDAILVVGLRSMNSVITNYSSDSIEIRTLDNLTKISIKTDGSKITIKIGPLLSFELDNTGKVKLTNAAGEFFAKLMDLLTAVQGGTVLGIPFVLPPNYAADLAILETFI